MGPGRGPLGSRYFGKLDIGVLRHSFDPVFRFRHKFIAVFLASFWLLAAMHCELEAAGLLESHAVADQACCVGGEDHCSHDGCKIVEDGGYSLSAPAKVSSPQLAVCFCLICSSISAPAVEAVIGYSSGYFERSLNWAPTWQFVQRAALAPRAPSLTVA